MTENNNICKAHSGCLADIANLKDQAKSQWEAINGMKKTANRTLISSVFSLLGIVLMLLLKLIGV